MYLYYKVPPGRVEKIFFSNNLANAHICDLQSRFQPYTTLLTDFPSTQTLLRHPLIYIYNPNMDV